MVIGGFGVTHAERSEDDNNTEARNDTKPANDEPEVKSDDPAKSAATRNAGRLIVRAVAAATGEPIEGVSIPGSLTRSPERGPSSPARTGLRKSSGARSDGPQPLVHGQGA